MAALIAACSGGSSTNSNPDPTNTDGDAGVITTPTVDGGNCGRDTKPCPTGAACKTAQDCIKGDVCTNGVCNVPPASCSDGSKDGDETDLDCGGSCTPCVDGKTCTVPADCVDAVCTGTCQGPSCTDKLVNGAETGVDCGGPTCPKCALAGGCKTGADCDSGVCGKDNLCAGPTSMDGVKNGTESDIDCGGTAPTNAPLCDKGKKCGGDGDCFWGHCNAGICGDHVVGTKDGDETDINCGGTKSPACDWFLGCKVDKDCTSTICDSKSRCSPGASCKGGLHGTQTCGLGEYNNVVGTPSHMTAAGTVVAGHETCCKSLLVSGYPDNVAAPGKAVYVDKYEITAGRMRAFVTSIANGNGGAPDIKTYTAAHRPTRWNNGWENYLPTNFTGSMAAWTTTNPTPAGNALLAPGQDQFLANFPTQSPSWSVATGSFMQDVGVDFALGGGHLFPDYNTGPGWPTPDYAAAHALNCGNGHGQYGYSTYWFDAATIAAISGGVGKNYPQDILDDKALNCSPNALFAAFCAWDGGQLATAEVMDYITGNSVQPVYVSGVPVLTGKYVGGNSSCGPCCAGYTGAYSGAAGYVNSFSDGSQGCYNMPDQAGYYPGVDNDFDDSSKITSPGRVANDAVVKTAGDEPWMDMVGNLQEAVLKRGEVIRFDYRGYGVEWGSIIHHKNQQTTPRYKSGSMGARCMRFK